MSFVHLHVHSDFSFLDGASKLPELVARAKALGQTAIALTDHGVMHGAIQLIKQCKELEIKPIVGNEMYLIEEDDISIQPVKGQKIKKYHLLVLAKNTQGYHNLCKLTSISHLQGIQGKGIMKRPCVNRELLKKYSEGLIVTSGCIAGQIPQSIRDGNFQEAYDLASWYKDVFGDDFYIEIQDHGLRGQPEDNQGDKEEEDIKRKPDESTINPALVSIASELGIKVIATNDSHFTCEEDWEMHDALLCIQTGKKLSDTKRMRYTGTEYIKSEEEMLQLFSDHLSPEVIAEAIANTQLVADKVEFYDLFGKNRLPDYPLPDGITADDYLTELSWRGLCDRFPDGANQEYCDRLEYELQTLRDKKFSTYFLVVWDYIKFAKDQGIPTGSGRGSSSGSLVAYSLRITNIDPIHHGLMWERFLNPERPSMPDIDTDFCIERRKEVVDYVAAKYGSDRVTQIATFTRLQPRVALKDTGRVLEVPFMESQRMTDLVPVSRGVVTPLKKLISGDSPVKVLKEKYESDEEFQHWFNLAMKVEGVHKTSGSHAAGVVIAAEILDNLVPLSKNSDGEVVSQYSMEDIESIGLLKMDFLGLKNLTMIEQIFEFLKAKGVKISEKEIVSKDKSFCPEWNGVFPEDVAKTYEMIHSGNLDGMFQLESDGMRQLVKGIKPSCFEDLSLIMALYRPGVLDNDLLPTFIARRNGTEEVDYPHPLLESVLKTTLGLPIYQEQIMKIAQVLSGYSLGEADMLRKAMGKKKASVMQQDRPKFIAGAIANNIEKGTAEKIFEIISKFAEYGFNLAHSMSYAYICWQTAYLKANYPVEFMAAYLTSRASGEPDKFPGAIAATKSMGISILSPNINESQSGFTPEGEGIRWGLAAIASITPEVAETIADDRKINGWYIGFADFCDRTSHLSLNKKHYESLINSGAFDSVDFNRNQILTDLPLLQKWAATRLKDRNSPQMTLFAQEWDLIAPPPSKEKVKDFSSDEKMMKEHEVLGVYLRETPLDRQKQRLAAIAPETISQILDSGCLKVAVVVNIEKPRVNTTHKNEQMAYITLSDNSGVIDGVLFPEVFGVSSLFVGTALILGELKEYKGKLQVVVSAIAPADSVKTIAMIHVSSREFLEGLKGVLKNCSYIPDDELDVGNEIEILALAYWRGELVAHAWIAADNLPKIKNSGFHCEAIAPENAGDLLGIFASVDDLAKCKNAEDLAECDRAFAEVGNDFKQKVWSATSGIIRKKISEIKAL